MRSTLLLACLLLASLSTPVQAQRGPIRDVLRVRRLSSPQDNLYPPLAANEIGRSNVNGMSGARPAVLLTGYWPPTNEMLREFSDDLGQNPGGWIGSDWEGRGYDVYAYFPEFSPANCWNCGAGTGDLTVDYQDTSSDFWPIVNNLQPIAIITFSRGFPDVSWEVEMNQFNRSQWIDDYVPPVQPTPAPPDATVPPGTNRPSTLPVQAIVDAVAAANLGLSPSICFTGNGGGFLSEFMAYHGVWYQAEHADPLDSAWCVAAGHVHVGGLIPWPTAKDAAKVTIRTVLSYVDGIVGCDGFTNYCQAAPNSTGSGSTINAAGSASIAFNSLTFKLQGGPPTKPCLLYYGPYQLQIPFGDGFRCVGGSLQRLQPLVTFDGSGGIIFPLDFSSPPLDQGPGAASPGGTWNFQGWYRDPDANGQGFNLTDAVRVVFCP